MVIPSQKGAAAPPQVTMHAELCYMCDLIFVFLRCTVARLKFLLFSHIFTLLGHYNPRSDMLPPFTDDSLIWDGHNDQGKNVTYQSYLSHHYLPHGNKQHLMLKQVPMR
jgi:hypothetical protein